MAIVARDTRAGTDWEDELKARLAALPGMKNADERELLAQLASRIRAGEADPGTALHVPVAEFLRAYTEARCRISAPKALGRL